MSKATEKALRTKRMNASSKQLMPIAERIEDEPRRNIVKMLISKISYLAACLDETRDITMKEGTVVGYDNGGGQKGVRVHPATQVYTQYSKTMNADLKQLAAFLPEAEQKADELQAFMEEHK